MAVISSFSPHLLIYGLKYHINGQFAPHLRIYGLKYHINGQFSPHLRISGLKYHINGRGYFDSREIYRFGPSLQFYHRYSHKYNDTKFSIALITN